MTGLIGFNEAFERLNAGAESLGLGRLCTGQVIC